MRLLKALLVLAILVPTAALAQGETTTRENVENRAEKEITRVNDILKIIGLPGVTEDAREAGVPDEDIRIILEEADKRELPPLETEAILREGSDATRESGPIDNFGAFVQERLDEGLRGQDLAAAIHAEHKMRGKGKGYGKGQGQGQGKNKERGKGNGKNNQDRDRERGSEIDDDNDNDDNEYEQRRDRGQDDDDRDDNDRDDDRGDDDGEHGSRTKTQKGGRK